MIIHIGADHKGFKLKEHIKSFLGNRGYEIVDAGNSRYEENDDYPAFAKKVAESVSNNYENARGILICGSGVGMDIVANKFKYIRSALVCSADQAFDSRNEDDANVLSLPASYVKPEDAERIVSTWLTTPFSGEERHERRLQEIYKIEGEIGGLTKF